MDKARYFIALITLFGLPPGLMLWFCIHPFAGFWRRLGPGWTYGILSLPALALVAGIWRARRTLLAVEFGANVVLIVFAVICLAGSVTIAVKRRRYLTFGILAGMPEVSSTRYPGTLLTGGPYARIRHPRYVEAILGVTAYALFANYLAVYVLLALSLPGIYAIVLLEERELRQRFGAAYEDYCRQVPRFWPSRQRRYRP